MNSIVNIGSEFNVTIPFKISEVDSVEELNDQTTHFDCEVLLVEDVPTNQVVAKLMLEKLGCTVDVASNGKKAIEMLDVKDYSMVFMDIQMLVMDGIEATKIIKSGPKKDVKIIGLSSNALMQKVSYYKEIGMQEFISKPISMSKLLKAFRRVQKS